MRLRWQLALGGGLLALVLLLVANAYVTGDGEAGHRPNRLTDPAFVAVALVLGGGAGVVLSLLLQRPLRQLTEALRRVGTGPAERLAHLRGLAPPEVVELHRVLRDLYERQRQAAQVLRSDKGRLEIILDSITEGILVTDRQGRVLVANRAMRDLFELVPAVEGRRHAEVVRVAAVGDAISRVLEGGAAVSCEVAVGAPATRHLDVQVAPIAGPGGVAGTVTVFYEITRLRRLERMRVDFVANVSHELRTPLTAIKGCAETLIDGALHDPQAATRFLGVIASHADRLTDLLKDLLDLSRLESERVEVDRAPVLVQRLADTAREAVSQLAAGKGIAVTAQIPEGLAASCDRRLIEQALINLVDNAVKYTDDGGRVAIRARRLPRSQAVLDLARRHWSAGGVEAADAGADVVVVEVTDTGIGIPSNEVERVFERFYRVDKGRSRALGGTGLGLSIVRHAIELHGERVFVDSQLGAGSAFGFTLPAA